MTNKLRAVADANILVSGTVWPRFAYEVLRHAAAYDYYLVLSEKIIAEARAAIIKIAPDFQDTFEAPLQSVIYEQFPSPSDQEIQTNINLIRDPKDVHVALAAMNSEVDFLITQDKDLTEQNEQNQPLHQKVTVILPGTFLREQMNWTSEALENIRKRNWPDLPK